MSLIWKNLTIKKILAGLKGKDFSAAELTKYYLARIEKYNPDLNVFLTDMEAGAFQAAAEADESIAQGKELKNLEGVPGAIKDVICTKGVRTTASSKMLEDYIPSYDATIIKKLKSEGYVPLGKTNCDEFAMGTSNENSAFGPVKNPWDQTRVPGGSSGGSAAAVAAGLAPFALGTDTGGSVRQPASLCGVVGFKPSYGRVSRHGLIALVSSFDQAGIFARSVEDAEIVFNAIEGPDPKDATTVGIRNNESGMRESMKGLKIGVPIEYVGKDWDAEGIEEGVKMRVREAIETFENQGAIIKMISLPRAPYALPSYYVINPAEASSNLARYDGIRYGGLFGRDRSRPVLTDTVTLQDFYVHTRARGFGPEPKRRIMLGAYVLSAGYYDAYYKKASQVRTLLTQDFEQAFKDVDVIASPTSPTVAFPLGSIANDPLALYLLDIFTVAVNLTGLPAISLPCGFAQAPSTSSPSQKGGAHNTPSPQSSKDSLPSKGENGREGVSLPVGLQLIGKRFDEQSLFAIGKLFQSITDHHLKTPQI